MPNETVILESGIVVRHRPASNGATEAYIIGQSEMTEAQWEEYCAITVARAIVLGTTFVVGSTNKYDVIKGVRS